MPRTRRVIQINPWQFSQVGRLESIAGETLRPGRRCRPPLAKPCSKTLNGGDEAIAVGASMNSLRLLVGRWLAPIEARSKLLPLMRHLLMVEAS
jgi:hypothetical protein